MKYWLLIVLLLLIPVVSADITAVSQVDDSTEPFYCKEGINCTIRAICSNNFAVSGNGATMKLSLFYPNSTIALNYVNMSRINDYYQYDIDGNVISTTGKYSAIFYCEEAGSSGNINHELIVNPSGVEIQDTKTKSLGQGIWIIFIIGVIFSIGYFITDKNIPLKWTFLALTILFFIITFNLIHINIADTIVNPSLVTFFDGFTAASTYIYWFIAGFLIILWIFTLLNTVLYKQNIKRFEKFG